VTASEIAALFDGHAFTTTDEAELQRALAEVLDGAGVDHRREVRLTARDRIDFLAGAVGIEVKVDGALAAVTRQLHRYALRPEVASLLLVTTRPQHRGAPRELCGKPVTVALLHGGLL
jgi:hypothetical protein